LKKNETDTDVGIEKTEKTENRRKNTEKQPENSGFADDDLLISSIFIFAVNVNK